MAFFLQCEVHVEIKLIATKNFVALMRQRFGQKSNVAFLQIARITKLQLLK